MIGSWLWLGPARAGRACQGRGRSAGAGPRRRLRRRLDQVRLNSAMLGSDMVSSVGRCAKVVRQVICDTWSAEGGRGCVRAAGRP